jgi:hypothetical protein
MNARKKVTTRGKVLSFIRANGGWLAVVAAFSSGSNDPVISHLVPIAELTGSARRKADRWVELLG